MLNFMAIVYKCFKAVIHWPRVNEPIHGMLVFVAYALSFFKFTCVVGIGALFLS